MERVLGAASSVLSLPHRLLLLSAATQLAAGNVGACSHGSARSNVYTDKHWCTSSRMKSHAQRHTHTHTIHNIDAALFLLLLAEFVLLSESLPPLASVKSRTWFSEFEMG